MPGERFLLDLDRSLLDLRRFTAAPDVIDDGGRPVDLSSLLVLDALRDGPASVRDVADRLDVAHSTASRFVTRAERSGFVTRVPAQQDARQSWVEATDEGRALAERAETYRIDRLADAVAGWESRDVADLSRLLSRFVHATRQGATARRPR